MSSGFKRVEVKSVGTKTHKLLLAMCVRVCGCLFGCLLPRIHCSARTFFHTTRQHDKNTDRMPDQTMWWWCAMMRWLVAVTRFQCTCAWLIYGFDVDPARSSAWNSRCSLFIWIHRMSLQLLRWLLLRLLHDQIFRIMFVHNSTSLPAATGGPIQIYSMCLVCFAACCEQHSTAHDIHLEYIDM